MTTDIHFPIGSFDENQLEPLWTCVVNRNDEGNLTIAFRHATEEEIVEALEYLRRQRDRGM